MLEQLKRLGGDSLLYALMNVGTKLIAFLMLPIYTMYLGPKEMGMFENIDAIVSILTFIIIFGTDNALAYYFFDTKEEKEKISYVQNVLTFRVLLSLIIFGLFFVFGGAISSFILGSTDYKYLFYIAGSVLVFEAVITLILTYYRFEFKSKKVVILTVGKLGLVAILSYVFLRYFSLEVASIYWSRLVSAGIIILALLVPIARFLRFRFDKAVLKKLLKYGAPLVPASIAFWVITFANRFFLTHFESLESVGIYGVAIKIATMISLLTSSVQMAWRPYSMSIKENPQAKRIYTNIFYLILIVGLVGLLGIATIAPYILQLMVQDQAYMEAGQYIAMLSLGSFLSFYYLIISVGLFLEKKTGVIAKYVGMSAVLSVVLNVILIPILSIWGAVAALIVSYLFVNIMIFRESQKVYFVPVSISKLAGIFIAGFISILAIVYIHDYSDFNKLSILFPWLFFFIVLYFSGLWKSFQLKK